MIKFISTVDSLTYYINSSVSTWYQFKMVYLKGTMENFKNSFLFFSIRNPRLIFSNTLVLSQILICCTQKLKCENVFMVNS